ncbi:MAG TPA: glycosyltransferase [Gaiellaceae bacterium]|nr:glycosyltransferase [Gaiellaceae bacterium]
MANLVIAAAADEAYAWPSVVALLSAAARSTAAVACLLLSDGIEAGTRRELARAFAAQGVDCEIADVDLEPFSHFPTQVHLTRATYARLLVPSLAQELGPRTVYLDADTLTFGDLAELASFPLDGKPVGACIGGSVGHWYGIQDWQERGYDPSAPIFNPGVMLIDNEQWLREGVTPNVLAMLEQRPELAQFFADQSVLNSAVYGRWKVLPPRWNRTIHRGPSVRIGPLLLSRRERVNLSRLGILHYFERVKPWDRRYPPGPFLQIYRSAWKRFIDAPLPPARTYIDWVRDRHALKSAGAEPIA